jgi:hypothetical protein
MQAEARPRIASRARAGSGRREGGGGKTAMDLYTTLGPRPTRLGLFKQRRARAARRARQPITRIGNRSFPMQTCRLVFYLRNSICKKFSKIFKVYY